MDPILEVEKLDVRYNHTLILNHLSLKLHPGEILGIVGESGSGKSTLIKTVAGILGESGQAEHGRLLLDGVDLLRAKKEVLRNIRSKKLGVVFQHPGMSFNPIRKIKVQFFETMRNGCGKIDKRMAVNHILSIFEKLNLQDGERILNSYPFELSGGMSQRVAIALAMVMNPQLLLADEPTSALDVTVQAQVVQELMNLRDTYGTAIILVTHSMGVVSYMVDKIAIMYAGNLVEYGNKADVLKYPQHPYTKALISAIPQIDGGEFTGISGQPPAFGENFVGCPFAPRCVYCRNECKQKLSQMRREYEDGHWSLCPFGCAC